MSSAICTAIAGLLTVAAAPSAVAAVTETYIGPCDASAAVALDDLHFAVGSDERNTLHIYRRGQPREVGALKLSKFLGIAADDEADIEGAAAIGQRVYWITSHGRDSHGKASASRHRLFATDMVAGNPPSLKPAGKPYVDLLRDLVSAKALEPYKLGDAARLAAEADGGFNIEGLAATPDGRLLIGLRNPLPQQRALVIPLENPAQVIKGQRARFGTPAELDLDRRGIRSIDRVGSSYLIVAGPTADLGSFALYRWSGQPGDPAQAVAGVDLQDLRPEALFAVPRTGQVQLLSDDGGLMVGGVACKKLPPDRQTFRSRIVDPSR
jgi:hypothetical protein